MSEKKCTKCGEVKAFSEYTKAKKGKFGLKSQCKCCVRKYDIENKETVAEYKRKHYQANKEAIAERGKQYRQANKESVAEYKKQYYRDNKDSINEYKNQWYQTNKESVIESRKKYYKKNKDSIVEYKQQYHQTNREALLEKNRQYRQANKEAIAEKRKQWFQANKEKVNKYVRERKANNPVVRMISGLRTGLWQAMNGRRKPKKTMELLGCSQEYLRDHLSAQFTEGMTLENYGEWHIDHIIPVASFDHDDPEQVAICWHYTNFQPLWAEDNLKKSDKLPTEHQVTQL